jgi:hypothetical protein
MHRTRPFLPFAAAAIAFAAAGAAAASDPLADGGDRVVLRGNVAPLAVPEFDAGPADPELPLSRMILVLARRPGGDAALRELLDAQLDPASPLYHRWLSPDEFGSRFGIEDAELGRLLDWLQENGFAIDEIMEG